MTDPAPDPHDRAGHWERVYEGNEADEVSWYQSEPLVSLDLIDLLEIGPDAAVVDVGGGASVLVDALLRRGFTDLTVLDISESALESGRRRVGQGAAVTWLAHDLLTWEPDRRYDLWHDRAVFHFLSGTDIDVYRRLLRQAVSPGGSIVMATFAPDGPEWCSGLPVTRYDASQLAGLLEPDFTVVDERREVHRTPRGMDQPFTWIAARRTVD